MTSRSIGSEEPTGPPPGLALRDERAQRETYERYLPIVRRIAMRTVRSLPPSITIDDVVSAGWLGMVEALGRRTAEMTEDHFEAFASYRVRGAILDYLRMLDPMSRKLRGASRRVTEAVAALVARLGRSPEQDEVAAELGIGLTDYQELLGEISEAGLARLELSDVPEPGSSDASPEAEASRREVVDAVSAAIDELPDRLKTLMGLYYQEECSFREIGEILGVTESRVCQLHSEAMHLIRARLEGRPLRRVRRRAEPRAVGGRP
ncbi:MAG: FliA/WhiG family RNA polymerase sigma factor [Deltaproteobacteria bacterium]|nr:FliA/WhiG family RNA polymerase sigma factor [Deltaproteobacteria bacterium]